MPSSPYQIRPMNRNEITLAIDWAAAEGWNPSDHDADAFYLAAPNGFLVGLVDEKPIACISAVKYSPQFGFIGFYIVHPDYRGQGYGIQIWKAALEQLAGCNVGLDGVVAQQENYRQSGFTLAYRNIRYEGIQQQAPSSAISIHDVSALPFELIDQYDQSLFPAPRPSFLKAWLTHPQSHAIAHVENNKMAGYGVIRKCRSGYKVGPLFANTNDIANTLLSTLVSKIPAGETYYLDVPETNEAAVSLAQNRNMSVVFETARMYTEEAPSIDVGRVYGVTSFELG